MNRIMNGVSKILRAAVAIGMLLAAGEIICRLFIPSYQHMDCYIQKSGFFSFRPGAVSELEQAEYKHAIIINEHGFRMTEPVDPGRKKIVMLGDSFTFGAGAVDTATYPALVAELLRQNRIDGYQVINAGVPGHGTIDQLKYLRDLNSETMNVAMVILQFNESDILEDYYYPVYMVDGGRLVFNNRRQNQAKVGLLNLIAKHSKLASYLYFKIVVRSPLLAYLAKITGQNYFQVSQKQNILKFYNVSYDDQTADMVNRALAQIVTVADYCRNNRLHLAILYTPIREEIEEKYFQELVTVYQQARAAFNTDKLFGLVKRCAADQEIQVIDVKSELLRTQPEAYYYPLDQHWNDRGNALVAETIFQAIKDRLPEKEF